MHNEGKMLPILSSSVRHKLISEMIISETVLCLRMDEIQQGEKILKIWADWEGQSELAIGQTY